MYENMPKSNEQAKNFFQQLLSPKEKQESDNIRYMSVDLGHPALK